MLLAFKPGDKPGRASMQVSQIILEPISAESFVLRAEATMESRHDLSRRDLEQALSLEPGNARAHWLYSRVLAATEHYEKAVKAAGEAVRLDPDNAQYRVTRAQTFAQAGQLPEALEAAEKAVAISEGRPHVKARATCMVADLLASGPKPDFKKALTIHTQALQLADPLSSDPHPAIRVAAKEVQIDAYLGAAHDIAWGEWKDQPRAVARWLERAKAVADDVVLKEGGSPEQLFRVYTRSLAAYVGLRDAIDPAPAADGLIAAGEKLIAAARDPGREARLQWELGMALYDAVQICQMRSESDNALKYGEAAAGHLANAIKARPSSTSTFLLGRLYFRFGTIHAMSKHDHQDRRRLVRQGPSAVGARNSRRPRRRRRPAGRGLCGHGRFLLGDRPARQSRRPDEQGRCLDGAGGQAGHARPDLVGRPLRQPCIDATEAGESRAGPALSGNGQQPEERDAKVGGIFLFGGRLSIRRVLYFRSDILSFPCSAWERTT